jgi:OmpA-OmpF porin, OOP family
LIIPGFLLRWFLLAACFVFNCVISFAQPANFVPNPGIESETKCPPTHSFFNMASPWYTPTEATTDWFCDCKNAKNAGVGVPVNLGGYQQACEGKCYAGIVAYANDFKAYSEYLAVQLSAPLVAGKTYYVNFYYNLADYSMFRIQHLGVWFSKKSFKKEGLGRMPEKPACTNWDPISYDTSAWHLFSEKYIAKGGETFIMIGCPMPSNPTRMYDKLVRVPKESDPYEILPAEVAYYFIDNVSVTESDLKLPVVCGTNNATVKVDEQVKDTMVRNEITVFKNLHFKTDESEILPTSFAELDYLAAYLVRNPALKLEIRGHTDNTGSDEHNIVLSKARAEAVRQYLWQKGVKLERMKALGYGSERPVDSNETPEGRARNRRVEFMIRED